jgi:hypothetical protein
LGLDEIFKFVVDPIKSLCIMRTSLVEASDENEPLLVEIQCPNPTGNGLQIDE